MTTKTIRIFQFTNQIHHRNSRHRKELPKCDSNRFRKEAKEVSLYNTSVKIYRTKKLNNGSRVTGSAI